MRTTVRVDGGPLTAANATAAPGRRFAPDVRPRRSAAAAEQAADGGEPAADHEAGDGGADQRPRAGGGAGAGASRRPRRPRRAACRPTRTSSVRLASIDRRISSGLRDALIEWLNSSLVLLGLVDRHRGRRRRARLEEACRRGSRRRPPRMNSTAATMKKPQKIWVSVDRRIAQQASHARPWKSRTTPKIANTAAAPPTAAPLASLADLLGDLGLGELDLLADEQRGALGDLVDRLGDALGGAVIVGGDRLSRHRVRSA